AWHRLFTRGGEERPFQRVLEGGAAGGDVALQVGEARVVLAGVEQVQRRDVAAAHPLDDVGRLGVHGLADAVDADIAEPGGRDLAREHGRVGEPGGVDGLDRREVRVQV